MKKEYENFIYRYKVALMEGKTCMPMVWSDSSLHSVITIDEAIRILHNMLKEEKVCMSMDWSDNSLHSKITIDEAIRISHNTLKEN